MWNTNILSQLVLCLDCMMFFIQFLIKTESMSGPCNEKPGITSPSPAENSVIEVKAGQQLHTRIYVKSNSG